MNEFFKRGLYFTADAGGESGGGSESGTGDGGDPIKTAVETATKGLKENRDKILEEKRILQEKYSKHEGLLEKLGGEDGIKQLLEFKTNLQKDELGKLVAEGKHDEWFDKRTAALRGDYEQKLTAATEEMQKISAERDQAIKKFNDVMLRAEVDAAGLAAGVEKDTLGDIHLVASQIFGYDPEYDMHVIKDGDGVVTLGKDGKTPKTIAEWLGEQKEKRRFWWPKTEGAGAGGGFGGGAATPDIKAMGEMDMAQYRKAREGRGMGSGYAGYVRKP